MIKGGDDLNKVIIMGRLVRDPEVRYGNKEIAIARFNLAVDRKFSKEKASDFPSIIAFGKQAEFVERWLKKGTKVGVVGRLQTGSYTNKDGIKVYTTDIIVEEIEFCESKGAAKQTDDTVPVYTEADTQPPKNNVTQMPEWMKVADGIDEELPFS